MFICSSLVSYVGENSSPTDRQFWFEPFFAVTHSKRILFFYFYLRCAFKLQHFRKGINMKGNGEYVGDGTKDEQPPLSRRLDLLKRNDSNKLNNRRHFSAAICTFAPNRNVKVVCMFIFLVAFFGGAKICKHLLKNHLVFRDAKTLI